MPRKFKVLFLCVGNACRSQMAHGFAAGYGSDVIEPYSAGLSPAVAIPRITIEVMKEKGFDISEHFPKPVDWIPMKDIDLIVNLSGQQLNFIPPDRRRDWPVADPIGKKDDFHRKVRDEVERLVMALILELRQAA